MGTAPDHFRIQRFSLEDGQEIRLFCHLLKVRDVLGLRFSLYEDHQGHQWLEIISGDLSCLSPLHGVSFEHRVAAELLTLGVNKYSG